MKNIMIVDGAINCAYDIFQSTNEEFIEIFGDENNNIQFIEDVTSDKINILEKLWSRPIKKSDANGIHGILFFDLITKKKFYPTKRDADLDGTGRAIHLYSDEYPS